MENYWREYAQKNITGGYVPGGDKSKFYDCGIHLRDYITGHTGIDFAGKTILDLGCGNGRLAMALTDIPDVRYVGVDVVGESIRFCDRAFTHYPNFTFDHADVYNNRYAPKQEKSPLSYTIPGDVLYDIVVANSFFTHTSSIPIARHYLGQCFNVLRDGGFFYSTWFKSPPNVVSGDARRTVYDKNEIVEMICTWFDIEKDWAGDSTSNHDQWRILARRLRE